MQSIIYPIVFFQRGLSKIWLNIFPIISQKFDVQNIIFASNIEQILWFRLCVNPSTCTITLRLHLNSSLIICWLPWSVVYASAISDEKHAFNCQIVVLIKFTFFGKRFMDFLDKIYITTSSSPSLSQQKTFFSRHFVYFSYWIRKVIIVI